MAALYSSYQPLTNHINYAKLFFISYQPHWAFVVIDKEICPPAGELKLLDAMYGRMIHGLATITDKQSMFFY